MHVDETLYDMYLKISALFKITLNYIEAKYN